MSNALFCDSCGMTFPENTEGSVTGNGTFTRVVDGVRKEVLRRQDQCPDCAASQQQWTSRPAVRPQIQREINARVQDEYAEEEAYKRASGAPGYGA